MFAILAFSTTGSFNTTTSFTISCYVDLESSTQYQKLTQYEVEYPFDLSDTPLVYLSKCKDNTVSKTYLDMDFSSSARFFVATGVLCFLFTIAALVVYITSAGLYANNPMFPVVDLVVTGVMSLFWLAGASAWAANVSDLKYYTGPRYLISHLPHCNQTVPTKSHYKYDCFPESPGKWSTLYISLVIKKAFTLDSTQKSFKKKLPKINQNHNKLYSTPTYFPKQQIFGFANLFLWASSMWFVYKETTFHRKNMAQFGPPAPGSSYPGIATTGGPNAMPTATNVGTMDQYGQMAPPVQQQYVQQQNY